MEGVLALLARKDQNVTPEEASREVAVNLK